MKLFIVTLLAVLAIGCAQGGLNKGVAHQVFKTAVNKLKTGTTRDVYRTKDAGLCGRCLVYTGYGKNVLKCRNTCKNTILRAYKDDVHNTYTNNKDREDRKTAICARCLIRNHLKRDFNINTCTTSNDFACTTRCRVCDLDKILARIYKTKLTTTTTGDVGFCPPTNNNLCNPVTHNNGCNDGCGNLVGWGGGGGGGGGGGIGGTGHLGVLYDTNTLFGGGGFDRTGFGRDDVDGTGNVGIGYGTEFDTGDDVDGTGVRGTGFF